MNSLRATISQVESLWLDPLYQFCQDQFSRVKIPSHDDLHHLRVWKLAKRLMGELDAHGTTFSQAEIEQIIIAIFFHDIGMVETIDTKHGLAGRHVCEKYFSQNYPDFTGDLDAILNAIEKHDDKAYKNMVYHGEQHKTILSILCVCDDLDAFGAVGVFRYMEIYMLRGISIDELAALILPNIESRYQNFHQLFGHLTNFHSEQTKNYQFIKQFYTKLLQGDLETRAILEVFVDGILNGNETINTISAFAFQRSKNPYLVNFFKQFENEISL